MYLRVEMEGLVHGNFSEADAERVLDDIEKVTCCCSPPPPCMIYFTRAEVGVFT